LTDRGLLDAAVAMPRATFDGARLHRDLPEMAAAYPYHLSRNHSFEDGNKRVAMVAALVFLSLNGLEVEATDEELGDLAEGLAAGTVDKRTVVAFYRDRVGR